MNFLNGITGSIKDFWRDENAYERAVNKTSLLRECESGWKVSVTCGSAHTFSSDRFLMSAFAVPCALLALKGLGRVLEDCVHLKHHFSKQCDKPGHRTEIVKGLVRDALVTGIFVVATGFFAKQSIEGSWCISSYSCSTGG